jgi:Integrase core domain
MVYLLATCTSRKRSEMVSPCAESCGPDTIDRHNVIDILQSHTIQGCRGSRRALRTLSVTKMSSEDMALLLLGKQTYYCGVMSLSTLWGNRQERFYALTIIDMVTNLTEIVRLFNRTSAHAATVFTNTWLAWYPKPTSCIYDQGSKFIGWAFQNMLAQYDTQRRPTTVKNPQANAICERMHQAVGNSLRVLRQWMPPNHLDGAHLLIDTALANAMYAMCATFHSGLMTTPGALSFGCDLVMNIPLIADLTLIHANRQRLIDERAISSKACHHSYVYQPGQEVLNWCINQINLSCELKAPMIS